MCEQTYVACGGCDAPVADSVVRKQQYYRTEVEVCSLDESGEPCEDYDWEDSCDSEPGDWTYECNTCGWTGTDLDMDCTPDDCECDECNPDPADEGANPDRIVTLVRCSDTPLSDITLDPDAGELPREIVRLLTDRTIKRLPLPRWRAAELHRDWIDPYDATEYELPVVVVLDNPPTDWERQDLMLTYD